MDARERLGRHVRRLRVAAGLSQEALALDAKLEASHVSRIERGLSNVTLDVMSRLAGALHVDVEALMAQSGAEEAQVESLKRGRKPKSE
jgi:transcriptional regulator with XRE-family HTH domain